MPLPDHWLIEKALFWIDFKRDAPGFAPPDQPERTAERLRDMGEEVSDRMINWKDAK